MFADYMKCSEALTVSNGTVALHLALVALGVGVGDEVIVPDLTFAATINAVIYVGATPVIVDVTGETWTMDPEGVAEAITSRTKALIPVHLYGHPADMDALMTLADRHGLLVVEDCAEALGSEYKDHPVGTFGDAATFSFYGNKTITTGEGGMVLFRDGVVASTARMLRDHGMSPELRYWHKAVGFNYRLTNLQAAVGVAQLEQLEHIIARKRANAERYTERFRDNPFIHAPPESDWALNSFWLYTVLIEASAQLGVDRLGKELAESGIETRRVFYPLHLMPPYEKYTSSASFPQSDAISHSGISIPSSAGLTSEEADYVADSILARLPAMDEEIPDDRTLP